MPKNGGSENNKADIPSESILSSEKAKEQVEKSSSQLQQNISSSDREDHTDQEKRVKEIRANKLAPTTAGRVVGGTPEIGHKFGDQKVFLEKNKVTAIEYPRLDQVWQATPDGKVQISRIDSHTGEKVEHVFDGKMSVEKTGDIVSAVNAQLEFNNGREVIYRDGSPTQIRHPDGEIWTRDEKDANLWHVAAHDRHHSGKTAHFDIHDVQVDAATGDIHWQVNHEGQNHLRRIDRNGQYADFAPGQPYTFVEDAPHSEKRELSTSAKLEAHSISTPEQNISLSKLDKPPTPTVESIQTPRDYKVVRPLSELVKPPADRADAAKPFENLRANPAHLRSMEAFKEAIKSDLGAIPLRPKDQALRKTAEEIQAPSYKKPEPTHRQNLEQTNNQRGPVPFAPPPPMEGRPQQKDQQQRHAANPEPVQSRQAVERPRQVEDKPAAVHTSAADQQQRKSIQISEPPRSSGKQAEGPEHSNPLLKVGAPPSFSESKAEAPSNRELQKESTNSILADAQISKSQQLIDPETGEIHIGKHTYSPEQIVAQAPGVVSDATPQRREPSYVKGPQDDFFKLNQRGYIRREDGSLEQFDAVTGKYIGTAVYAATGKTVHDKAAHKVQAINEFGDINKLGTTSVKFVNLYKSSSAEAGAKIENQTAAPAKASFTKMEPILAPVKEVQNLEKETKPQGEMQKLPMPSEKSHFDSAAQAGELIKSNRSKEAVAEINKHLMDIEYSGASPQEKAQAQWKYIQEALSAGNIRMKGNIEGNFWIVSSEKGNFVKLEGTSLGDVKQHKDPVDRSKLVPVEATNAGSTDQTTYASGKPLQGSAQFQRESQPVQLSGGTDYNKLYGDRNVNVQPQGDSLQEIEWDNWRFRIQEHLTNSMRPYLSNQLKNSNGTISFNFDVSRTGQIGNVTIQSDPRNSDVEANSRIAVATLRGSHLLQFPKGSQLQNQHFGWSLHYGSNIQDGTGYQSGQNEIIRRKQ